jgi:sterol desaturase/sphingolipid hydroxylase (fatty acid hydroxylase superfamily)
LPTVDHRSSATAAAPLSRRRSWPINLVHRYHLDGRADAQEGLAKQQKCGSSHEPRTSRRRRRYRSDVYEEHSDLAGACSALHRADPVLGCNPGRPWWRKRDLVTDVCYWFFIPVVTRYFRIGLLIAGAAVFFHITTAEGLIAFYENGHGPLAALPLVVQMLIFLVGEDVITYWTHRLFHGGRLWKYHAVHHSSEELEWISAARFHPINLFFGAVITDVVLVLAGISPNVFVVLGPVTIAHSAFVHANLDWTFGPFKYVIATPVFHRWHHTAERGGEKNFAATFPVLDLIFGTFYMPAGEKPDR